MSWSWNLPDASTTAIAVLSVSLIAFILTFKLTRGKCHSRRSMKGKTVIITGCTSGIGKETARDLARRGARVIMACRNVSAAYNVRAEIKRDTGNQEIEVRQLDLGSLKSVREFCAEILRTEKHLDVLIHNAGTADAFTKKISPDGYELTIATNHYGPFLMTHLLIDLMKKTKSSRIVIVASSFYRLAYHSLENAAHHPDGFPWFLYYLSKYANIMFSLELARRLQGTGVTVNCLHPGLVDTGIWRAASFPLNIGLKILIALIFKDSVEGAQTSIYAAVSEELDGVTGKYFLDCREAKLTRAIQDPALCNKLWEECERMVKLGPDDPRI